MRDIFQITWNAATDEEAIEQVERIIAKDPRNQELRRECADAFLDAIIFGQHKYGDLAILRESAYFRQFVLHASYEKPANFVHSAIIDFVNARFSSSLKNIQAWLDKKATEIDYTDFVYSIVIPFKEGFPGMWSDIGKMMKEHKTHLGLAELCFALEKVYYSDNPDEIIDALTSVLQIKNNMPIVMELLGYTYYNMEMWKNAIAWFEQLESIEEPSFFLPDDIYFWMGWAHGKVKNHRQSEVCYRKALELNPNGPDILNNLGYCLYQQKRYTDAQSIFDQCIKEKRDLAFARNNMVRVLLASGQYKKAADFVKDKSHISKDLIRRVEQIQGKNDHIVPDIEISEEESSESQREIILGVKLHQFTSEKILEDELVRHIENGADIFGIPLFMYRRKGAYGRQFIIPVGRLDILAEDNNGNLYAIELKKDSGYTDVYEQITRYMKWLEDYLVGPQKKVFGIIVVNNPQKELLDKVRRDERVKLFSYQISYSQVG